MILDNKKVAKFLGMSKPQMYKLMKVGKLNVGVVGENGCHCWYYIYKKTLEDFIGRGLTEEEFEYLKK